MASAAAVAAAIVAMTLVDRLFRLGTGSGLSG
jgi:hypothetical protein